MKKIYCYSLIAIAILLISLPALSQDQKYSRAKIYTNSKANGLLELSKLGIAVDHGEVKKGMFFISDFSEYELQLMKTNGFNCEILIEDVSEYYVNQNKVDRNVESPGRLLSGCNAGANNYATPANFSLGSMGGFFTYAEMLTHLDNMAALYPNLITIKDTIGSYLSVESRPIFWLKISDNPNVDEAEPEVLYNAVHHAREAASLSQMIFYMWYLLENYATDPDIQNLVNNTEMYFVPCVNPDGYIHNQTTNPNGGGMWRKNRKNNGDGTYGVDLNRNYGYFWGYDNTGSSPTTSSETYRGTAGFSEPETQALKYFCENRQFKIALNYHTYGNLLIYPWGYGSSIYTPDSAIFVNYAQLLTKDNNYVYGTGDQTVGYVTNGDSDDWMYGEQGSKPKILSMTPEAGEASDGFWPASSNIVNICKVNISQNLYMAHLAGKYAIVNDASPTAVNQMNGFLNFNIKRLGLDSPASFTVSIQPLTNMSSAGAPKIFNSMYLLEEKLDSISFILNPGIVSGQQFSYVLSVSNGLYTEVDTITKTYGTGTVVFAENGSSLTNWTTTNWGLSSTVFYSPSSSITDSPPGNYPNNANRSITLSNPVSLNNVSSAILSFWAKWEIETGYDYVQVMASNNGGSSWTPLCGNYTKPGNANQDQGMPLYDAFQTTWVKEEISLNDYLGQNILIRFRIISDGWVNEDGFYFDDLTISTIPTGPVAVNENEPSSLLLSQNLPNPANDYTYINYTLPFGTSTAKLLIYTSLGQFAGAENLTGNAGSVRVNTSHLASGVYYYQLTAGEDRSPVKRMAIVK